MMRELIDSDPETPGISMDIINKLSIDREIIADTDHAGSLILN